MTRCPGVKAALIWMTEAIHELQVVDEVLGLHLVSPSVGDTRPQFRILTHGCLILVK